jgi:hypothetical protein
MTGNLTWLFLSALVSAAVAALWSHLSKRSLQRDDNATKVALATLEDKFERSQRLGQAAIDRSVFVTRAHFETEFEAMKEVFSCLSQVKLTMNSIRPFYSINEIAESDQSKQTRLLSRLEALKVAYNKLLNESEAKEPFYTAELYAAIQECLGAASMEINDVLLHGLDALLPTGHIEGGKNRERFSSGYRKAAAAIRDRISRLAILPSL